MKFKIAAMLLVCASPYAAAKDRAYFFNGTTSGVEIEQASGSGGLVSGFSFDKGCTNEQQLIWIHAKAGPGVIWSYTGTDPDMPGYVLAYFIDESSNTWNLYAESAEYGIPIELINGGGLQKTKPCPEDAVSTGGKSYLQRLAEARLINHGTH